MEAELAAAREALADLIAYPGLPLQPNRELVYMLQSRLSALGADLTVVLDEETGDRANLVARFGPAAAGGVMLAGHLDVVPATGDWTADPFYAARRGGRIHGRGACDMKGFLACLIAVAPRLAAAELKRPVLLTFTYDEEVGCLGAQRLMAAWEGPRPATCIVGEPTRLAVVDAHKGCYEYTTVFRGLAGHGSAPDRGANAIEACAVFVAGLRRLADALRGQALPESPFDPPWTTISPGMIRGGAARNVIPDHVELEWEFRPVTAGDAAYVKGEVGRLIEEEVAPLLAGAPDGGVETHVAGEVAGLERLVASPAADLAARLGGGPACSAPFGTEAGIYQAAGIPTVVCGPGDIAQAHTIDEFIEESELAGCLAMLGRLADELAA